MVTVEKKKRKRKDEENVSDSDNNNQRWVEKVDDEGANGGAGGDEEEITEGGEVCQIEWIRRKRTQNKDTEILFTEILQFLILIFM